MQVEHRTLEKLLDKDFAKMSRRLEKFISTYVSKSSAKGLVIGMSGGLDSSVVLRLAVGALSTSRVLGLAMPSKITPTEDMQQAIDLANSLGLEHHTINIDPILEKYEVSLHSHDKRAIGNLTARIRMNLLYYYGAINGYLVAGTSDKSEIQIGYFTKWGDGAADIMPIAGLYKTQVRALAKYLGIPQAIVEKKSSPRLWDNHLAEEELGMDYDVIDPVLYLLVEKKMKPTVVAKKLEISTGQVNTVKEMRDKSTHKRNPPPIAPLKS